MPKAKPLSETAQWVMSDEGSVYRRTRDLSSSKRFHLISDEEALEYFQAQLGPDATLPPDYTAEDIEDAITDQAPIVDADIDTCFV